MSKVLESFLVALGFETDDKGLKEADNGFRALTAQALKFGSIIAGVKFGQGIIQDFAESNDKLGKFQRLSGISVDTIDTLGYALKREGGSADTAYGVLEKMFELINTPNTERDGWLADLARSGIADPEVILNARTAEEAFGALAERFRELSKLQQMQAGRALGFDDATIRLLAKGREGLGAYIKEAHRYKTVTQEQVDVAARFLDSQTNLERIIKSVSDTFANDITRSVTSATNAFNDWYAINKKWIDSGIKDVSKAVADNMGLIAAAVGVIGASTALATLGKLLGFFGAGGAAAGLATAGTVLLRGGIVGASGYAGWSLGDFLNENIVNPGVRALTPGIRSEDQDLGGWLYDYIHGDKTAALAREMAVPYQAAANQVDQRRYVTINVNGGDPNEVRKIVREEVGGMTQETIYDFTGAVEN